MGGAEGVETQKFPSFFECTLKITIASQKYKFISMQQKKISPFSVLLRLLERRKDVDNPPDPLFGYAVVSLCTIAEFAIALFNSRICFILLRLNMTKNSIKIYRSTSVCTLSNI